MDARLPGAGRRLRDTATIVMVTALSLAALAAPAGASPPSDVARPSATAASDAAALGWNRLCAGVPSAGLRDVSDRSVHASAIDCAVRHGIVKGTSSGDYQPTAPVTRAQMAAFIARLVEQSIPVRRPVPDAFGDDDGGTHEDAINVLASLGVVQGIGEGRFGPDRAVTRAQMTSFLTRAFEVAGQRLLPEGPDAFRDDDGSAHEVSIDRAAAARFATGAGEHRFDPAAPVRRDQMASFVVRTLGCLSLGPDDPSCAAYRGGGIPGFDVRVGVDGNFFSGREPVRISAEACNRRTTVLEQRFPQRDWAAIEVLNSSRTSVAGHRNWYDPDPRYPFDGIGYAGTARPGSHTVNWNLQERLPRTAALTFVDGPQTSAGEIVRWQPGECKPLPVPAWHQLDNVNNLSDSPGLNWVSDWSRDTGFWRVRPGPHAVRVHWGGIEVGQPRRLASVDSAPFQVDGPSLDVRLDKASYRPGETAIVTLEACNLADRPYTERWHEPDQETEAVATVQVRGMRTARWPTRVGLALAHADDPGNGPVHLKWAAGECKQWPFAWDQRWENGTAVEGEAVRFEVWWHTPSYGEEPTRRQIHDTDYVWLRR